MSNISQEEYRKIVEDLDQELNRLHDEQNAFEKEYIRKKYANKFEKPWRLEYVKDGESSYTVLDFKTRLDAMDYVRENDLFTSLFQIKDMMNYVLGVIDDEYSVKINHLKYRISAFETVRHFYYTQLDDEHRKDVFTYR
jgi:hypothetical protein